ncbi:MAG: hypothetical protein DSM107014_00865 [Gomphosphaeria aponina SAG 52.96 = DSM 107014]|uniref:Uncharacterized protein n=1 Tax=Gomphosphaeria aponina SAG 52.96 = DSM 107014 TaxID=1521640 RepID=A0A941JS83_9CHRO|nr:hypothetical protein [Gomphosphaeria aponina SAG 52.96 = DSM 107014]
MEKFRSRERGHHPHKAVATESALKSLVYFTLSVIATGTCLNLLNYDSTQKANLREVEVAVQAKEERVAQLRDKFNRNFDPHQTRTLMQEQSPKIDSEQLRVILLD